MAQLPSNFDTLSPLEKRDAVTQATGLTWEQYSGLAYTEKNALLNALKGNTYETGTADMFDASQQDATANKISGWFVGLGTGLKLAAILAVCGAGFFLWKRK